MMAFIALMWLGFMGCVSDKDHPDGPEPAGPRDTSDTGSGSEDTGEPALPDPVAVTVQSEPVVCDEPWLRGELGPMQLSGPGGDCDRQKGGLNL